MPWPTKISNPVIYRYRYHEASASLNLGKDIGAGLKSLVGGELRGYSELLEESRQEAISRMIEQADRLGADAIIAMRFGSSQVMSGAAEFVAYGTAVKLLKA